MTSTFEGVSHLSVTAFSALIQPAGAGSLPVPGAPVTCPPCARCMVRWYWHPCRFRRLSGISPASAGLLGLRQAHQ